jgi:hypothetical protein
VLSANWQIGSISEERAGKRCGWALGVGTPFDPDKVKMHGSGSTASKRPSSGSKRRGTSQSEVKNCDVDCFLGHRAPLKSIFSI